jgi:hypothetical protein
MLIKNTFSFPQGKNLEAIRNVYASINGADSFEPARQWRTDTWSAEAHCSTGKVLEKAGAGMVQLNGGAVEGVPTTISLMQTMAYPAHPCLPGCIVMASTSQMEGQDPIMMVYTDLIDQNGKLGPDEKKMFSDALAAVCKKHNRSLDEYQAFMTGRGMLYFFEEVDGAFLGDCLTAVMQAYQDMVTGSACPEPTAEDTSSVQQRRQKMITWMLEEDYGTKVARENNIDMEVMQMYGFPPTDART